MSRTAGIIVGALVVAAASFYGGMYYGSLPPTPPPQDPDKISVTGHIISTSTNRVSLQLINGSGSNFVDVLVPAQTPITFLPPAGTLESLKTGLGVVVYATRNADGTLTAQSIREIPAPPLKLVPFVAP